MKLENPQELVAAIEVNNALTAQLKEFQTTKEELDAANKRADEADAAMKALEAENKELKDAAILVVPKHPDNELPAEEKKKPETKPEEGTEPANKVEPVADGVAQPEASKEAPKTEAVTAETPAIEAVTVESLQKQVVELTERLAAFIEAAADAEEKTEKVQDQFENLAEHLAPKGEAPEIIEAGDGETEEKRVAESRDAWLKLAKSKNPLDQRKARLMKKADPRIAESIGISAEDIAPESAKPSFSADEVATFTKWQMILAEAKFAKQTKQSKLEAEKIVEARRFRNKTENKPAIDACLTGGLAV